MLCNAVYMAQELLRHDNFILITHRNPDGDTLGSSAALCLALRRAGKTAWIYPNEQITEKFLPYLAGCIAPAGTAWDYAIAVDVAAEDMRCRGYEGRFDFCIDHHPTNPGYADVNCIDPSCSACGEIILAVDEAMNGDVSREEATRLYIALSTDTGCFQYGNTNAAAFEAAAKLLRYGAESSEVNLRFFRKVSCGRVTLESMIYAGMQYLHSGEVAIATITSELIRRSGATENDLDDLANLPGRVEGVKVGITMREKDGGWKVSVRTMQDVPANRICAAFGGGGHAMASGCTIPGDLENARARLLAVVEEVLQ